MNRRPAKKFQDLILTKDLGYGDTSELMSQLGEVSKILEAFTSSILNSGSLVVTKRDRNETTGSTEKNYLVYFDNTHF